MSWPTEQLGDLVDVVGGGTPSRTKDEYYGGTIPWATVRDMSQEYLTHTELRISEKAVKESSTKIIPAGSVIIATRVGLGKVCILGQETAINQDLKALIPKCNRLDARYLFWWIKSVSHVIEAAGVGATVKGVKLPFVKGLLVPVPPLEEQTKIVEILDRAFDDIDKTRELAEQNLENARELFESYLHQVFTRGSNSWAEANLGEICEVSSGGTPKKSVSAYWQGDIPWYSSGELNHIYTSDSKEKTTEIGIRESNAKIFPSGSLLIGMYDTAALKMSILDRDGAFNQAIAGVKPNDKVNLEFILYSIEIIKPQLLSLRRGVRQKNLNQSKVREIPLRIPDLQVQDEVVRKITSFRKEVDELLKKYRDKLDLLEILRQSLLDKLLNTD